MATDSGGSQATSESKPSTGDTAKSADPASTGSQSASRRRNRGRKQKPQSGPTSEVTKAKFTGACADLKGSIYHIGATQADLYIRSTKAIAIHVGTTYTMEARRAIEDLVHPTFEQPKMPIITETNDGIQTKRDKREDELTYLEKRKLDIKLKKHIDKEEQFDRDMHNIYALIEGQCSDAMIQKMKADDEFKTAETKADPVRLLQIIKNICYSYLTEQFPILSLTNALKRLMNLTQGQKESNIDYLDRFTNCLTVFESCGGSLLFPGSMSYSAKKRYGKDTDKLIVSDTVDENKIIEDDSKNILAATLYLLNSNGRYSALKKELANDYLKSTNNYPEDTVTAQSLLLNYSSNSGNSSDTPQQVPTEPDVMFAQNTNQNNNDTKRDLSHITCSDCGLTGHYPRSLVCPTYKQLMEDAAKHRLTSKPDSKATQGATPKAESAEQVLMYGIHATSDTFNQLSNKTPPAMFCQSSTEHISSEAPIEHFKYSDLVMGQAPGTINRTWILLDNQSTCNLFVNGQFLHNIRPAPDNTEMHIHCNAGTVVCRTVGDLAGFGTVWYHPKGIANVLSLAKVKDVYRVRYDSEYGNIFEVDSPNKPCFRQSPTGLYYYNMIGNTSASILAESGEEITPSSPGIETVEENINKYTERDVSRADRARRFQETVGASLKTLLQIVDRKLLTNCPITREDIKTAEKLYGPSLAHLKGKTTRSKTDHVGHQITPLPPTIMDRYKQVVLCADIVYINSLRFLTTISRNIQFGTASHIKSADGCILLDVIRVIQGIYMQRGFIVESIHMDGQFESIKHGAASIGIQVNVVSRGEHVPEIERYNRTIKERARSIYHSLPFNKLPTALVIELIAACIFWLNAFPPKGGISNVMGPREIITGMQLDYKRHCKLQFGQYVQVHEETTNTTKSRTVGALALRPTGNKQGGYFYYSLTTGRRINRGHSTPLPMPAEVMALVEQMAKDQPETLTFADRNGNQPIMDINFNSGDDDSTYATEAEPIDDDLDADTDEDDDQSNGTAVDIEDVETPGVDVPDETNAHQVDPTQETPGVDPTQPRRSSRQRNPINDYNDMSTASHLKTVGFSSLMTGGAALARVANAYMHVAHAVTKYTSMSPQQALTDHIDHTIMSQYSVQKGLKMFGQAGADAVSKELQQIHDRNVIEPKFVYELTKEQRSKALSYLMFLKEKRDGSIKGRGCADGRKQRDFMSKEDTSAPTVATETLILTCMIDAMEARDVATADIPGAFLQTDYTKGDTHVLMEGAMVDLLVKIDPQRYTPYVFTGKSGKQLLYAETTKAMYGTLNAALLFWEKFSTSLTKIGFTANPYDWCCVNMPIEGSQCTIVWHVDDLKISHVNPDVVGKILSQINDEYGTITPLTVTRGKRHEYLGMTIDYSQPGKVMFTMYDYINKMLVESPADMSGEAATPAGHHLFAVNDTDPIMLSKSDAILFHHLTAMLLFLAKRARPDTALAVAFLCTRVQKPDTDDYKKLARVIQYLRGTIGLPLLLKMDSASSIRWYVDAAFAVHNDMKSHTGAILTFGNGAAYSKSSKQKLNTKSSTEAEFVGVDDVLPQVLWTRYFLQEQGYEMTDNVVFQDNQSAMKLEKNGKRSSSKRTRHINIRYYFVTDRIASNEMSVEYCPTLDMLGDYFTKSLQGSLFRKFRNFILGITEEDIPRYNTEVRAMLDAINEHTE